MINDTMVIIDIPGPVKHLIELVEMPTMPTVDVDAMLHVIIDYAGRAVDNEVIQEVANDMAYGEGLIGRNDLNEVQAMNLFNAVYSAGEVLVREICKVLGRSALPKLSAKYYDINYEQNYLAFTIRNI